MPIRVLHIIESFGAGTLTALSDICRHASDGMRHIVFHAVRPETPDNFQELFPESTEFIKSDHLCRDIQARSDYSALREISAVLKKQRPDVVHTHSSKAGALGRVAAWLQSIPSVHTPHGYNFLQAGLSPSRRFSYKAIEWGLARVGTAVAACGEEEYILAKELSAGRGRVRLIPNAIDMAVMETVPRSGRKTGEPPRIGTSGRYTEAKNPAWFHTLARDFQDAAQWTWIGADMNAPTLPPYIAPTGWQSRANALALVADLDIFIQTSLWEGLSYSILEAMALGKPVVASRIPANIPIIEHGVTGFLASDVQEFARHLETLIASPELRETMGAAGIKAIRERYGMAATAKGYMELYRSLAGRT